jgi:predicted TIM-barrel fold metal-dependent hydrolase
MKTVDIHTHLLNPGVRFDRLVDRVSLHFFARKLGLAPERLRADPYGAYVQAMARAVRDSRYVSKVCLFGVDARLDERGREIHRDRTVCAGTEDVIEIAVRYPEQFIPFFSVNPRRPGALELIDAYLELGCRGAKFLQNYWGLDLNDERLLPYYEKLRDHGVPLIVHIGSEYTIASDPRYEGVDMLDLPVAAGVTVIAAHMGLGRIHHRLRPWRNLSRDPRDFDPDYFALLERLRRHDNLYGDISAILAPLRARALRHLAGQHDVHPKILFGTDFPVPFSVRHSTYDLPASVRRPIDTIENPFDRYAAAVLEYFPAGSPIYRNHAKVLPGEAGETAAPGIS